VSELVGVVGVLVVGEGLVSVVGVLVVGGLVVGVVLDVGGVALVLVVLVVLGVALLQLAASLATVEAPWSRFLRRVGSTEPGRFATALETAATPWWAASHCPLATAEDT